MMILHADDNKSNDSLENLSYGTASQNQHDAVRNGKHALAAQTSCKRHHEFTPENTKMKNGRRVCRACERDYQREWRRNRKRLT